MAIYDEAGNKIRRNSTCPCGSGEKFKHCHGKILSQGPSELNGEVAELLRQQLAQAEAKRLTFQENFGKIKPIISGRFRDWRLVAVGNELHYAKVGDTRYFPDFLLQYIRLRIGTEWGKAELAKPLKDRHPVAKWYDSMCRFQIKEQPDIDGVYRSAGNGALLSWYRLAYDLYLIKHNADLQEKLLQRIRNNVQFQGARFELAVTASMIVAGFEIRFEDESDINRKHTEFLATHRSGIRIAVEAKSRHRDVVLEYKAPPRRSGQDQLSRVSVEGLIRKALSKDPDAPYFIFIDVNLPYSDELIMQAWVEEITATVDKIYRDWLPGTFPANAIFFCNDPTYQDPEGIPDQNSFWCYTLPVESPRHPLPDSQVIVDVAHSIIKRNNIPNEFPEQEIFA